MSRSFQHRSCKLEAQKADLVPFGFSFTCLVFKNNDLNHISC